MLLIPVQTRCRIRYDHYMLTEPEAFARSWIQAWNSHDLDAIMSHYATDVVLVSPLAAKIMNCPSGTVEGREALRCYFSRGLEMHPTLAFKLLDVLFGVSRASLFIT